MALAVLLDLVEHAGQVVTKERSVAGACMGTHVRDAERAARMYS
jgi:hypothetical protein